MATIKVTFTVQATQEIEWPDDELDALDYDNLCANIDIDKASISDDFDIIGVLKNGEWHNF